MVMLFVSYGNITAFGQENTIISPLQPVRGALLQSQSPGMWSGMEPKREKTTLDWNGKCHCAEYKSKEIGI